MTYICVCSDVTAISLSLTTEEIRTFCNYNHQYLISDDQIEKRIDFLMLDEVDKIIGEKIEDFWRTSKKAIQPGQVITEIGYKEKIFSLQYSNQVHFKIATLITLKKLIDNAISKKGSIYFFNKTILKRFRTKDVLAFMKVKNSLSLAEIEAGINELAKEFGSLQKITEDDVRKSLEFLELNGFVDNDIFNSSYFRLTGKGYILTL